MFAAFERLVAFRYLRTRRSEGFISVIAGFSLLGIALGVATLIVVLAVFNGFRQELLDRILGLNGHLSLSAIGGTITDFDPLAEKVRAVPGVVTVTPTVEGEVMATATRYSSGALARAVRRDDLERIKLVADNIKAGSLDEFQGNSVVALGSRLAERLHVKVGDAVTLIMPQTSCTVIGCIPRSKTYDVVAIFEVGMSIYDGRFIYMPLEAGQLLFQAKGAATDLNITVDDPDEALNIGQRIYATVGPNYQLIDWQQYNAAFFAGLAVQRAALLLIMGLITLVAALNVISGQVLLVKDKAREIAILRTMGAAKGSILRIFLLSGFGIGLAGTVIGVGLGILVCNNIETLRAWLERMTGVRLFPEDVYFLSRLPAQIAPSDIIGVVLFALVLSLLATTYPAWRGARLDPVEALRYE
jgi:lipoprotein-releasing system permease protein